MLEEATHAPSSDGEFVQFALAGTAANGDYRCSECGYGVTIHANLPQCPMCAGTTWEPADWSALARRQYQA
jgi:rubrerythrin